MNLAQAINPETLRLEPQLVSRNPWELLSIKKIEALQERMLLLQRQQHNTKDVE